MKCYKLMNCRANGSIGPLYVDCAEVYPLGVWLEAKVGPKKDETHVKSKLGALSSKHPGFHCTRIPFTDWIGTRVDGELVRRQNNVWCEVEIMGDEVEHIDFQLPDGYYYFRTNSKQKDPWIITRWMKINRILTNDEVDEICVQNGVVPQRVA